jgi:hypothetical protein
MIPNTKNALVLRTDFSDDTTWTTIQAEILQPIEGFLPYLDFIDDPSYSGVLPEELLSLVHPDYKHTFIVVADSESFANAEHPLLVIDTSTDPGREFRSLPSEIQSIENNLSIANMDFEEFADAVDDDGVYRGM